MFWNIFKKRVNYNMENFLTKEEKELIKESVKNSEKNTSGEIRVAVIGGCHINHFNRAVEEFNKLGIAATQDHTGVLICIFVDERKVFVLADKNINEKVPKGTWDDVVKIIIESIKDPKQVNSKGIIKAVELAGKHLSEHFPRKADDVNELPDEIIVNEK